MEIDILSGLEKTIERWRPTVFIELQAGQVLSFESLRINVVGTSNIVPLAGYSPRDFIGWQRTVEDGVHQNSVLHQNLGFWSRFVRAGGVICGHDCCDEFLTSRWRLIG
jgi:hypothetical protein